MQKERKPLTEAQKAARLINIKKAGIKRMENLKQKREAKKNPQCYLNYDEESESSSESDNEAFIISKKKPNKQIQTSSKKQKNKNKDDDVAISSSSFRNEIDEMKNILNEVIKMQKKQKNKQQTKKSGDTVINVLPPQPQAVQQTTPSYDNQLNQLKRSFGM